MSVKTIVEVGLETMTCITCGVVYAMPTKLRDFHLKYGGTHYCPNGHGQVFSEPEIPILRKQLAEHRQRNEYLAKKLDGALANIATKQREISRMKRRGNAGVCQHCHRHFENVEKHIRSKHQDELSRGG